MPQVRTTSRRFPGWIVSAGLLVLAASSIVLVLRETPAFNLQSRVTGLFGDWRVPVASALYNQSDYMFQIGFGLLQGDLVASAATEERDELASIETAVERARRARAALEASASLAPGNAYTWAFLGWAAAMEGDQEGARAALDASWRLAPRSFQLAPIRLNLFELLIELGSFEDMPLEASASARKDLDVLKLYNLRVYNQLTGAGRLLSDFSAQITTD